MSSCRREYLMRRLIFMVLCSAPMIGFYFLVKWAVTVSIANYGWPITLVGFVVWAIFCLWISREIDKRDAIAAAADQLAASGWRSGAQDKERAGSIRTARPDYSGAKTLHERVPRSLPILPTPTRHS